MNFASSERVKNFLDKSAFTWNDFWQMFSFLRNFSIGQTFTSYDQTYCLNWVKWTARDLLSAAGIFK